jgi:hypothetical protein
MFDHESAMFDHEFMIEKRSVPISSAPAKGYQLPI